MRRSGREMAVWLMATVVGGGEAMGADVAYRRVAGRGAEALAVGWAVDGAQARLERQWCVGILDEFRDAEGRTLRANLDATGLTPGEFLDHIVFYDGERARGCRSAKVLALTTPGNRVVLVCAARFVAMQRDDPRMAEVVVIHEALHSLGLRENPPRSSEITARVLERCGH